MAQIKPGRILYEMNGVDEATARRAMELASAKLPFGTRFLARTEEFISFKGRMIMSDYREQTLEELLEEEKKLRKERVTLRFQHGTRQLLDTRIKEKQKKSGASIGGDGREESQLKF